MPYLLLFLVVMLSGCAPMQFENAGSQNKFEDDKYDCEVMLGYRGHAGGNQPTDQLADMLVRGRDEMKRCLERKGWKLAQR
jgi:hypothetical protein